MATFTGFKFQTLNMKKTNVGKGKKKTPRFNAKYWVPSHYDNFLTRWNSRAHNTF